MADAGVKTPQWGIRSNTIQLVNLPRYKTSIPPIQNSKTEEGIEAAVKFFNDNKMGRLECNPRTHSNTQNKQLSILIT
jgi:hypothetical protein